MKLKEIIDNLCWYDARNPDADDEFWEEKTEEQRKDCGCDNCFYGRHELAVEVLRLSEVLENKD